MTRRDRLRRQRRRRRRAEYDLHHVPPRHPANVAPNIIWVKRQHHEAYNTLFGNAGTFEQCVEILQRNWWNVKSQQEVHEKLRQILKAKDDHIKDEERN